MKTILPVLFYMVMSVPALAYDGPRPCGVPQADMSSYFDNSYLVKDSIGCETKTAFFQDDTFYPTCDWAIGYSWDFGDGTVSTAFDPQPMHVYTSPGLYTVTMTVTTALGRTITCTKTDYILVGSSFSVNLGLDQPVCGYSPVVLDATTPGATYLWNSGETTPNITDTTTNGDVSVIVSKDGCVAKDTFNISRTILSVDLGPDRELCDGSTLTLSGGNPGADIEWSTGDNTPDLEVWDGGEYYVDVTKNGCSVSDTVNIILKPELNVGFGFQKVGGCLPVDIKFTDSSTTCSGSITSWFWEFGDGGTSTQQNPTHTFTTRAQFPVRLTITAASGSTSSRTKKVIVNPPVVTVDLGADTTICFGESVTLDAANPGAVYTWSTGETSQQITVYDDGDYNVLVDVDGCTAKDTVKVRTAAAVAANFGYNVGGNCLPVSVSFSDSSQSFCGQSVVSYKWSFGDGTTSTLRNPVHVYTTADTFNVKLTVMSSGGSSSMRTKKVVVTNTAFNVDLPDGLKVCRGGSVGLDAVVTGAQYAWSPSFGLTATDIRNPVLTPALNSWYAVTVTKCSVTRSDSVYITIDSMPKPVIQQDGNSLKAPDASTYQWYFEGKPMSGAVTKAIRVDKAGYYTVKAVNGNGCENLSDRYFYIPVSGNEKDINGFRMKISPNPARGYFNVLLSDIPAKPVKVTVYDAAGKQMLIAMIQDHVNTISALKLAKGLYFVEIVINNTRTILPLAIQ